MTEEEIKNLIPLLSIVALSPFLIISSIGLLILYAINKKHRKFIISVLLISIALLLYIASNYILEVSRTFSEDLIKTDTSKVLFTTFTKLKLITLTVVTILFSIPSLLLLPNGLSKLKTSIFFSIGALLILINLSTDNFLSLSILKNKIYENFQSENFLSALTVSYFTVVSTFETLYLLVLRKRTKPEYLDISTSVIYGFLITTTSGIIESLGIYRVVHIPHYLSSPIGIGITLFSIEMFITLTSRYIYSLKENTISIKFSESTKNKIKEIIQKIITCIDSSTENLSEIKQKIEEILSIPKITETSLNETKNSIDNVKQILKHLKTENTEITTSTAQILELTSDISLTTEKKNISETDKLQNEIEKNIKNIKNFSSKEPVFLQTLENISKISSSEVITFLENIQDFYENIKVQLINILILSEKQKNSEFATILAKEILEKLEKLRDDLSKIYTTKDRLKNIEENINTLNIQIAERVTKIISTIKLFATNNKLAETNNLAKIISLIEKDIERISNQRDTLLSSVKSLENRIKEIEDHSIEIYSLIQDTQDIYSHTNSIITTAKEIKENIIHIEETLNKLKDKLTR